MAEKTHKASAHPRSANPLIHTNWGDTIAATRDYVADMANSAALDDQLSRGNTLRLLVVLNALEHLATENFITDSGKVVSA